MSTRKFSRVNFSVTATIKKGDRQFQGAVENLSMTGMFLVTNESLVVGDAVDITVVLTGTFPEIAVSFSGIVTRIAENGVGFTFEKIDLDSYMHLKNIIAYNIDDAEKVMEEIGQSIDEKFAAKK
ncbi:MAG: PilZ domain-containing protein [Desulfuromonadaceae bacterium]|nr:PilZ domain-containing protein [Desulfuromonadaceae bacterium]MDD5105530.1 PilZ domain-containing protein [Desulfuromonadaceae bacterium]